MKLSIPKRYQLLFTFVLIYLTTSFLVRIALYCWSFGNIDFSIVSLFRIIFTGLFFDVGTISFFTLPYGLYLLIVPNKLHGSWPDRIITYFALFVGLTIFVFSFFAEFTFWEEFSSRFNFIAVDYLVYTNEVVENINESYPLPVLLSAVILVVFAIIYIASKKQVLANTFAAQSNIKQRLTTSLILIFVPFCFILFIENEDAEWSLNRYENELSKSGIYSFFAAFRNNELEYTDFYLTQDLDTSVKLFKQNVVSKTDSLTGNDKFSIKSECCSTGFFAFWGPCSVSRCRP